MANLGITSTVGKGRVRSHLTGPARGVRAHRGVACGAKAPV